MDSFDGDQLVGDRIFPGAHNGVGAPSFDVIEFVLGFHFEGVLIKILEDEDLLPFFIDGHFVDFFIFGFLFAFGLFCL